MREPRVDNEIISYLEMCQREGASLQKGMNFFGERSHSVVLMSVRRGAPYRDRIEDDGRILIYEGHDAPRGSVELDPKVVDQPEFTPSGSLTENGRFVRAAMESKQGAKPPRLVRVYEKLHKGIWSYNGEFFIQDAWQESDGSREVFKFRLVPIDPEAPKKASRDAEFEQRRLIPTQVKLEVWRRDKGRCVKCGASDGLHFDHLLAYSRGGSSVTEENIQLLCARHNLEKGDRIE
jgi:hypothetical protein